MGLPNPTGAAGHPLQAPSGTAPGRQITKAWWDRQAEPAAGSSPAARLPGQVTTNRSRHPKGHRFPLICRH